MANQARFPIFTAFALFVLLTAARSQTLTVLHTFEGGSFGNNPADGANPAAGLTQDAAGNLYGTTQYGGSACSRPGCGVVFKMSHRGSGWVETILYAFTGVPDGADPSARVTVGPDGAVYGTTTYGGTGTCGDSSCGTVFRLQPPPTFCRSVSCPWRETVIHDFSSDFDGAFPYAEVIFDQAGNLYGTTQLGGGNGCAGNGCGTVFELTPNGDGTWSKSTLYSFQGGNDGENPMTGLVFDQAGNLYGTTELGGGNGCSYDLGCGTVFELSPPGSGWTETILYSFTGGADGSNPSALTFDRGGNLWGAVPDFPLSSGFGAIFELMPAQGGGWNFTEPYTFTLPGPAQYPNAVTFDAAGNIYGTAQGGGEYGYGTAYKLTRSGSGWSFETLASFDQLGSQGYAPVGKVVLDAQGNLYGVCEEGNASYGSPDAGTVWEVTP